MIRHRHVVVPFLALACALAVPGSARAQSTFPDKPIRLVVPYGTGSIADTVPRLISSHVSKSLGQPLVLDYRPGAGGNIGAQNVLNADADGYTLLSAATNNIVINQYVFRKMTFDPLKRFLPVAQLVDVPLVLTVNASSPITSLKEFVTYARTHAGGMNYASPSTATIPHLATEIMLKSLRLDATHVPYKSGAEASTALIANDVQFLLIGYSTVESGIRAGRLRPIAVMSATPLPVLPGVPTVAAAGHPELVDQVPGNWWAIMAKEGTPPAVVDKLSTAFRDAVNDPLVRERYEDLGLTPSRMAPSDLTALMTAEAKKWAKVVADLNLSVD
jgi:tripartite-type tricarboxylate transporter receptor subunit TctC